MIKSNKGKQKQDAWLNRCQLAHAQLLNFNQVAVQTLLEEHHAPLMGTESVITNEAAAPDFIRRERLKQRARLHEQSTQAGSSRQPVAQVAGMKRRADAVELRSGSDE